MDKITLPPNGLPQEVTNIPYGQVFVLTDPSQGITSTAATQIQAIISIAGKLGQSHIVYAIPVEYSGLWGCFICKVKTDRGVEILLSKKDSILEMLCEFWGVDYTEVSKTIDISYRYKKNYVSLGGESHPVRVHVKPAVSVDAENGDYSITLQLIQSHSKADELLDIRRAIQNSFYHNLDISVEEIIDLYEEVKKSIKTYHLDIDIKRDELGKISSCDISLKDNLGKLYPLKQIEHGKEKHLEPQLMAFYLTFIWFKEGKRLPNVQDDDFYETLIKIQSQLPYRFRKPTKDNLAWYASSKKSVISKSIWDATHDSYAQEQFGIEGNEGEVNKVAGATDEDREKIKKEFGL
jgi:hypothetical protein